MHPFLLTLYDTQQPTRQCDPLLAEFISLNTISLSSCCDDICAAWAGFTIKTSLDLRAMQVIIIRHSVKLIISESEIMHGPPLRMRESLLTRSCAHTVGYLSHTAETGFLVRSNLDRTRNWSVCWCDWCVQSTNHGSWRALWRSFGSWLIKKGSRSTLYFFFF